MSGLFMRRLYVPQAMMPSTRKRSLSIARTYKCRVVSGSSLPAVFADLLHQFFFCPLPNCMRAGWGALVCLCSACLTIGFAACHHSPDCACILVRQSNRCDLGRFTCQQISELRIASSAALGIADHRHCTYDQNLAQVPITRS